MKNRVRVLFIFGLILIGIIQGVNAAGGGTVYFHTVKNIFVDVFEEPLTTDKIEVNHLVKAPNTKDYWERFQSNIRKDYLTSNSLDALQKQLSAKQLTYEEQLRRVIKDNEKVWTDIKTDLNKGRTNDILKNILHADNIHLGEVNLDNAKLLDSKFIKEEGGDIFQYGKEKGKILTSDFEIKKLRFDGMNISINENSNDSITFDSGRFFGGESLTLNEKGSGRIEKPFENIDCSGKGEETRFIRDLTDLEVLALNQGEFLCSDGSLMINGKSEDKTSSEIFFENMPLNTLKQGYSQNNDLVLQKDGKSIARVHIPNSPSPTNFRFNPSKEIISFVSFFNDFKMIGFLPLISALSSDRGAKLGQFVYIINQDISLGGEKILIEVFKPFEKLDAKGVSLKVLDGEMVIEFKDSQTYYPRLIKRNEFFINEIRNNFDSRNVFQYSPGGSFGNYFIDRNKRLSVGDKIVQNPLHGYGDVMIPEIRFEMWKRAEDSA